MSASRSASGPSNAGSVHARRGLGATTLAERDRGAGSRSTPSRRLVRRVEQRAVARVAGLGLVAHEVDGERGQPGARARGRPTRPRGRRGGPGGVPAGHPARDPEDPRPERLAQRPGDPRQRPGVALGAVVEEPRRRGRRGPGRPSGAAPPRRRGRGGGRRRASRRTGRAPPGAARPPAPCAPRPTPGPSRAPGAGAPYAPTRKFVTPKIRSPRYAAAEQEDADEDDEPVLGEDRPQLPALLGRQEPEQDRRPVERRDRDEVEDREQDVERHEVVDGRPDLVRQRLPRVELDPDPRRRTRRSPPSRGSTTAPRAPRSRRRSAGRGSSTG